MEDLDLAEEILHPNLSDELCLVDSSGELIPSREIGRELSPYTQATAVTVANKMIQGLPLEQACEGVEGGLQSILHWKKNVPEFAEALQNAIYLRNDFLLEKSYQEDVYINYEEDVNQTNPEEMLRFKHRLSIRERRAKLVANFVKDTNPERYKSKDMNMSNQSLHLTINVPKVLEEVDTDQYLPQLSANGNLEVPACQRDIVNTLSSR